MRTATVLRAMAIAAAMTTLPASARDFIVDTTVDLADRQPGDGACATAEDSCSLRAAIQEANAWPGADRIVLAAGSYAFAIAGIGEDAGATGDLDVAGDLAIEGAGAAATIVDASALDRLFDLRPAGTAGAVSISGLTLRNGLDETSSGSAQAASAGVRVAAGVHLHLADVVLRDNRMTTFNGGAALDVAGCVSGERLRILDNGDPAPPGSAHPLSGAIVVRGGDACLHLADSEISGNRGDVSGALYLRDQPTVSIRRSLVADNIARFAGAIEISDAQGVLLEDTTISGNRGNPGAILNDGFALLTLVHCTVTGNRAAHAGAVVGGIQDVHGGFGRTFLSNTIVAGNGPGSFADDCDRAVSVAGGNIIGDAQRCHFDAQPADQPGVDPALGPLADNGGFTRSHLPGAPAIDRGADAACTPLDQRGIPRPSDGDGDGSARCDAGAVEAYPDGIFADGFEDG